MKQSLLTDIELDVQELKYLFDTLSKEPNQALCEIAKRSIEQMHKRLDNLNDELAHFRPANQSAPIHKPEPPIIQEEKKKEVPATQPIETAAPIFVSDTMVTSLRKSISLNDSFRFARELFGGDTEKMNKTIQAIDALSTFEEANNLLIGIVDNNEEDETFVDFIELVKKSFI